jgi:hypothetical protein
MKIEINGVSITLTNEQLHHIAKNLPFKYYTLNDLNSYDDAQNILKGCLNHKVFTEEAFVREKDWISYQLETVVKSANFIDNKYKEWIVDFKDTSTYKYLTYFKKTSSGWLDGGCDCYCDSALFPVGFYFLSKDSGLLIQKRFATLYNKWLG